MTTRSIEVIDDPSRAAALLAPIRRGLLERLREPGSAASLARDLGEPRQRLNHHLRALERVGLIRFVDERRRGNCLERRFRATAHSYLISPEALGSLAPEPPPSQERLSWAYLVSQAGRMLRDLATLRRRADAAGKHLATLGLVTRIRVASPRRLAEMGEALASAVADLAERFHDEQAPEGRAYQVVVGAYPALTETPHGDADA